MLMTGLDKSKDYAKVVHPGVDYYHINDTPT